MTTWLERVPVDEITAQGKQARPGRALATLIFGIFFVLGWLAGKTWNGIADCIAAVRIGWRQGRGLPVAREASQPGPG